MNSSNGTKPQRDATGRFLPGNTVALNGGGGQPRGYRHYIDILKQEVTYDRWREVVLYALQEATGRVQGANVKAAREFLARYVTPDRALSSLVQEELLSEDAPFGWGV